MSGSLVVSSLAGLRLLVRLLFARLLAGSLVNPLLPRSSTEEGAGREGSTGKTSHANLGTSAANTYGGGLFLPDVETFAAQPCPRELRPSIGSACSVQGIPMRKRRHPNRSRGRPTSASFARPPSKRLQLSPRRHVLSLTKERGARASGGEVLDKGRSKARLSGRFDGL